MRIIAWSDLHAHPWQEAERPGRWGDYIRVIREVRAIAAKRKADALVFCGDLFESSRTLRADVASAVYAELLHGNDDSSTPEFYLSGNHDRLQNGHNALEPLRYALSGGRVILPSDTVNSPPIVTHGICGVVLGFLPNGAVMSNNKQWAKHIPPHDILFTHTDIADAYMGGGLRTKSDGVPFRLLMASRAKVLICGHYHHPQSFQRGGCKCYFVGSPIQNNWSDLETGKSNPRGVLEIDITPQTDALCAVRRIPLTGFPRFLRAGDASAMPEDFILHQDTNMIEEEDEPEDSIVAAVATGSLDASTLRAYAEFKSQPVSSVDALVKYGLQFVHSARS